MRILFVSRFDALVHRGGDTIQMEKLADQLQRAGHEVVTRLGVRFSVPSGCHVVHIFNLQRLGETAVQVARARARVPTVLSPIFGDVSELDRVGRSGLRRALTAMVPSRLVELGKQVRRVGSGLAQLESIWPLLVRSPAEIRRWILSQCSGVYPNSEWEAAGLRGLGEGAAENRIHVVPNAVDETLLERGLSAEEFRKRWRIDEERFVLCVARFDERKNNLRLIRAAKRVNATCMLIGQPAPLHRAFFTRCVREAGSGSKIRVIQEQLTQEELVGAYRCAWVHALPSWLETPGLVNLEAGICGANVVVGDCPPVREYLAHRAWYCKPGDEASIADALEAALTAPRGARDLARVVRQNYTWSRVTELQERLYTQALS